jgi:trigger factor
MSKLVNSQYENDLTYNVDYLVENNEYTTWRQRLLSQILSNVEVSGFRKGKAPAELAMKQLNMSSVEETILQETISKFGSIALDEAKQKLVEEGRVVQNQTVDFNPEFTGTSENGFKFRVVLSLLPKIDLSGLEKLKEPKIDTKDLPERVTKEAFIVREESKFLASLNEFTDTDESAQMGFKIAVDLVEEVAGADPKDIKDVTYSLGASELPEEFEANLIGLKVAENKDFSLKVPSQNGQKKTTTVKYKVTVKKVLKAKYTNLQELFENSENAKKQFESQQKFDDFLANYYDQESNVILEDLKKRKIIDETLKAIPDFSLPVERTKAEQNRILKVLQDQAQSSGQTLGEVFKQSGISEDNTKNIEDAIEIKKLIDVYVNREFKWIFVLRSIYEFKVEDKITNEQLETVSHEMEKKPEDYNIAANAEHEYYHEVAYDRLMRSKATAWLFALVLKV